MATKYLNDVGLRYFYERLKTVFANKDDFDTLYEQVQGIVSEGGEPNLINSISVNGTAVTPDGNKNVALTVPTNTSDLTNDGDGTSNFATEAYVTQNGGKIDTISVNGTAQTITNKNVDITVPTKLTDLTNDGNFVTDASYVHTDNNYTTTEKNKLANIEAGAEVNVIETINVNNSPVAVSNKAVNLTVPTKLTDLTNDGNFVTDASYVHTDTNYTATDKGKVDKLVFSGNVIDESILPSYVDDVVEVYPVGATELASNWFALTAGGAPITPESGKIYVLMADSTNYTANSQFRFGGTTYVKLSDGGVSAITTAEIDTIMAPAQGS